MIGQSLIANTSACPRSDKRVPDYLFAKGLTAMQPGITRTTASDHWPVTRDFRVH